ncbi:MAG: ApaG protein [Lentimonas sp.]
MSTSSKELYGLRATLDRLVYFHDSETQDSDAPHAFIYFITIANLSSSTVTLNGRRWVIKGADGHHNVFEGQGIVGKFPKLAPGESFSYNSHHTATGNCTVEGSFHGIDSADDPIHVRIPPFEMTIPPEANDGQTELDLT